MSRQLRFLSGLPRSGSTVLTKILNQNPDVFASSTSPLLEFVEHSAIFLADLKATHSSGHYIDISRTIKSATFSFYDSEKPIIVDKNRGWLMNYSAIKKDLVDEPKIILTLRPVEEIVTSFYMLFKNNGNKQSIEQCYYEQVEGLVKQVMSASELKDRMCIIEYNDITKNTRETLFKVENFIGAQNFTYDLENIVDTDPENDEKWGIPNLHKIRSTIKRNEYKPEDVMSKSHLNYFKQQSKILYGKYDLQY